MLVVVAVVNTAISAYYYLRLIVVMFFRERTTEWVEPKMPALFGAALLITVVGVLYLGIFSNRIIERFSHQPAAVEAFAKSAAERHSVRMWLVRAPAFRLPETTIRSNRSLPTSGSRAIYKR